MACALISFATYGFNYGPTNPMLISSPTGQQQQAAYANPGDTGYNLG